MISNRYLWVIIFVLIISHFDVQSQNQQNDDLLQVAKEPDIKKWGFGMNICQDKSAIAGIKLYYRPGQNQLISLGLGSSLGNELVYTDGSKRSRSLRLKENDFSLGWGIALAKESSFFFETEIFYRWTRSKQVREWVSFDHLPYQKRFNLHHDVDIYGIQTGLKWIGDMNENFKFFAGLYPQLSYVTFPDRRQSDPLYIYPVRKRIFNNKLDSDQKYLFSLQGNFGFIWYII